jgi:hypothetical protein
VSDPTDPATFHAALRALLIAHDVQSYQLGPRQDRWGVPQDDIEGRQLDVPRVKVTTVSTFFLQPREVQGAAWFAALNGLPGVLPYPEVMPNAALGGSTVWIRWLDNSAAPELARTLGDDAV